MKKTSYVISRRNVKTRTVTIDKYYSGVKDIVMRYVIHCVKEMFEASYTWKEHDCIWAIASSQIAKIKRGKIDTIELYL